MEIVRTFFLLKGGGGLLKISVIGGTENMMGCDLPGRIGTHAATVIYHFWEIFLEFILAKMGCNYELDWNNLHKNQLYHTFKATNRNEQLWHVFTILKEIWK